jgi:hypothetical protein
LKQTFNLSAKQSRTFLNYFNAALRDPNLGMILGNGKASFEKDHFVIHQDANFEYANKKMFAMWKIVVSQDGKLVSIENENTVEDKGEYDLALSQLISDVLQQVVADKTVKFFRRSYFTTISGNNLAGEYWLPGFRFAPLFPDDDSRIINAERVVVIDQNVDAIDMMHANEVASELSAQYAAYLSFILDIGLERPRHQERYFLTQNGTEYRMERKSTQLIDKAIPGTMPAKGELCRLAEFKNSVFDKHRYMGEYLVCPVETRGILRGIDAMPDSDKRAFISCCLLYQLGATIGAYHPTVRTSYECAAIDALVKTGIHTGLDFKKFMKKYSGGDEDLYDMMYGKIRSAHFHTGAFPLGELEFGHDFIQGPERFITFNILMSAHQEVRTAILSWLDERTGFVSSKVDK